LLGRRHERRIQTSSAMGLPRRVITTASPASATVTCTMAVDHLDDQL